MGARRRLITLAATGCFVVALQLVAQAPASAQHTAEHGLREVVIPGIAALFDGTYILCDLEKACVTRNTTSGAIEGKVVAGARVILSLAQLQWYIDPGHSNSWTAYIQDVRLGVYDASTTSAVSCTLVTQYYNGAGLITVHSDTAFSSGWSGDQMLSLYPGGTSWARQGFVSCLLRTSSLRVNYLWARYAPF